MWLKLEGNVRAIFFFFLFFKDEGYYGMFVGTGGNDPAEKEDWMTHKRENKARVRSANKRKGTPI